MMWILLGVLIGCIIWFVAMRPMQLREHERRRRAAGLPRQRRLPEDN
jgi:preprotein translocase subunit YajC